MSSERGSTRRSGRGRRGRSRRTTVTPTCCCGTCASSRCTSSSRSLSRSGHHPPRDHGHVVGSDAVADVTFPLKGRVTIFDGAGNVTARLPRRTQVTRVGDQVQAFHGGAEAIATGTLAKADDLGAASTFVLTMDDGTYWSVRVGCGCGGG